MKKIAVLNFSIPVAPGVCGGRRMSLTMRRGATLTLRSRN